MSDNKTIKENSSHFYWLDLIRFTAAFAVLACHFRGAFFVDFSSLPDVQKTFGISLFYAVTRLGFESVLIFFVLSGFLVGGRSIHKIRNCSFNFRDYVIDRAVRIMLPLIASLLLYWSVCLYCHIYHPLILWVGNLFSLQGIVVAPVFDTLWSLSYEVWFYILMGGIAILFRTKNHRHPIISVVLLMTGSIVFLQLNFVFLFVWFAGAAISITDFKKNKMLLYITLGLSIILIAALQMTSASHTNDEVQFEGVVRNMLIVIFGFIFAIVLQQAILFKPQSWFTEKINNIGTKLAAFSYTLYLTHIPVMEFLQYIGAPKSTEVNIYSVTLYCLWLLLALVIAYILYLFFEKHTQTVKQKIRNILK